MKIPRVFRAIGIAATVLSFGRCVSEAQWTATGAGPFLYDDIDNWKNSAINDRITSAPQAGQTISFTTDRSMPKGLFIEQPVSRDGSHHPLSFRARNETNSADQARTVTLGGPIIVDLGKTNDTSVVFGDNTPVNFDFGGKIAVFDTISGNTHIELRGPILNAPGLLKRGEGRLNILDDRSEVTGEIHVERGWVSLAGKAVFPDISRVSLVGRSVLALHNEGVTLPDRLPDTASISCSGAAEIRLTGERGKFCEETLGTILLKENCLELWVSSKEGGNATLTLDKLVRNPGTILIVGYETPQATSRVRVANDKNLLAALAGGEGGAGSTTISIIPWVRAHGGGNMDAAAGFLTYTNGDGFRELDKDQEFVRDLNAASNQADNVRIASEETVLTNSKTINSLYLDFPSDSGNISMLDLGGNRLTITSGAISLASEGQISNGTLTTGGDRPLIISGPVNMNARLEGNGGLIYFGGRYPELRLGASENTLTGDYLVAHGALRLGDAENIPDTVTVRLQKGTELVVEGSESISGLAGTGHVRFATRGRSMLMLGRSEGSANHLVVGQEGEIHPGDVLKGESAIGDLYIWHRDDAKDHGSLEFADGTLFVDLSEEGHDGLILDSENKSAHVAGGTLSVKLLNNYKPRLGSRWNIIRGTAPATGQGFEAIEDASRKGYKYSARPVNNDWVLELIATP